MFCFKKWMFQNVIVCASVGYTRCSCRTSVHLCTALLQNLAGLLFPSQCPSGTILLKVKVFYGQEPPSGESTTAECGVNYQLLAVITEAAQWGTPSCSQSQLATDNGVRDGRSNWLVAPPTLMGSTPWAPHALYKSVQSQRDSNVQPQHVRQPPCLCDHSGYKPHILWCGTGGFQEQGQCFFIGLSCSIPTIV